jgi:hypothetical protein
MNLDFIPTWANAIAQFEGTAPGTVASRNNNPGNLKYAGQAGAIGKDASGFAIFPDPATGFQALYSQLAKYVSDYPNDTILDITAHYLGQSTPTADSQGNAYTYAAYVASALGTDMSTTLGQLAADPPAGVPVPPGLTDATDPTQTGIDVASLAPSSGVSIGTIAALAAIGLVAYLWFVD